VRTGFDAIAASYSRATIIGMAAAANASKMIERFILDRRADGQEAWCPLLRATISRRTCAERHQRDHTSVWFGNQTDALASPQDKKCNACELGRIVARRLGVERTRRGRRRSS
jgi:hypothetical protein